MLAVSTIGITLLLMSNNFAFGQYMGDQSSTFVATWATSAGIYGYGATEGYTEIHDYAVDVYITSPNNRQVSSIGSYDWGFVSNTVLMQWDSSDLGSYEVKAKHRGWCTVALFAFTITWNTVFGTVGSGRTVFTDPVDHDPLPGCTYLELACSSGTPTCVEGALAITPEPGCPAYMGVNFLTYTRLFETSCFPIAEGEAVGGPGPCY
jgi:hypothetical protein